MRPYFVSGAVKKYEIKITDNRGVLIRSLTDFNLVQHEIITDLQKYSEYCVTVTAVTTGGRSNASAEICAFTDEDGKKSLLPKSNDVFNHEKKGSRA